jgi:hypothetical protein
MSGSRIRTHMQIASGFINGDARWPPRARGLSSQSGAPFATSPTSDSGSRQPGLDADTVTLYRHHRCLQALQCGARKPAKTSAGCRASISSSSD